jgi:SRSO17 transposase
MSTAALAEPLRDWDSALSALKTRIAPVFRRRELQETAGAFLDGLLSGIERKTGWLMAECSGAEQPYRMQSLLGRSRWDADALRDEVRSYVREALGDDAGVLIVDETGFVKKGAHSVGVARQYSGTAGRIENCQIGVFLAYASRFGQALIDRRLYLPEGWVADERRRNDAHVPEEICFATKPVLAREMIAQALDAGVPCAWVLGDALYGSDKSLRVMLEQRRKPHVLAVRSNEKFMARAFRMQTAAQMADAVPLKEWRRFPAGEGTKGLRLYDWTRIRLERLQDPNGPFEHWLLVRRSCKDKEDRAYYVVFAPRATTLAELAAVAGLRWTIEECFERAKNDLGLDHCEARSWHGWHRHVTLCMAALAFLIKLAAELRSAVWDKPNERSPAEPIAA